jgi:Transglutaminase-like superfamily
VNRPVIDLVQRFTRPGRDWLLLAEAMCWLMLAWIAIAVLPFRHVGRLASVPVRGQEPAPEVRAEMMRRIPWAIGACARRVPWRAKCFEQGLAAQFMLRRRGMLSVLYYGAAPDDNRGVSAHVWVRDGDVDVIGGEIASDYAVLAMFPPAADARRAST